MPSGSSPAAGDPLAGQDSEPPTASASRQVTVVNDEGLHIRAASQLAQMAGRYEGRFVVLLGDRQANARSIMELLTLGAGRGSVLLIEGTGLDAVDGVDALVDLIERGFRTPGSGS